MEATLAKLSAKERELVGERKARARAEEAADEARLIAQFANPRAFEKKRRWGRYIAPTLIGALLMLPLVVHQTGRAQIGERKIAALTKSAHRLLDKYGQSQAQVAKYASMLTKVYASGSPAWLHTGFAPVVRSLLACQTVKNGKRGAPIFLKGVTHGRSLAHVSVESSASKEAKLCILRKVADVRFDRPHGAFAFHVAIYPPALRASPAEIRAARVDAAKAAKTAKAHGVDVKTSR